MYELLLGKKFLDMTPSARFIKKAKQNNTTLRSGGYMSVIPATWEAEIGQLQFKACLRQRARPYLKKI
jgi:hypothetical protein